MITSILRNQVKNFEKVDFLIGAKASSIFKFPIKMSFLANFQNYRRQLGSSSFDGKFQTKKRLIIFFDETDTWRNMTSYVTLWHHIWIWRYISSKMSFIKWKFNQRLFSMKFSIEWAISELATKILKICQKWNFLGEIQNQKCLCTDRKNPNFR